MPRKTRLNRLGAYERAWEECGGVLSQVGLDRCHCDREL